MELLRYSQTQIPKFRSRSAHWIATGIAGNVLIQVLEYNPQEYAVVMSSSGCGSSDYWFRSYWGSLKSMPTYDVAVYSFAAVHDVLIIKDLPLTQIMKILKQVCTEILWKKG